MKKIKVQPLTKEGFSPFGVYTDYLNMPLSPMEELARNCIMYPCAGKNNLMFFPLPVEKPDKMIITTAEYHNAAAEAVLCLDDDIIVHAAPAGTAPSTEFTQAFLVPMGTMVRLDAGVWHYTVIPVHKELIHVLIALPEGTSDNDCQIVQYPEEQWAELEL